MTRGRGDRRGRRRGNLRLGDRGRRVGVNVMSGSIFNGKNLYFWRKIKIFQKVFGGKMNAESEIPP